MERSETLLGTRLVNREPPRELRSSPGSDNRGALESQSTIPLKDPRQPSLAPKRTMESATTDAAGPLSSNPNLINVQTFHFVG